MPRRIGIFGGSFNPVHRHHVRLAMAARDQLGLDEVRFVPVFRPVHKAPATLAPFPARVTMLARSLEGEPGLVVDPIEGELAGPSFTIRTVKVLQRRFPGARLTVLIGGDSLADLHTRREVDDLVRLVKFGVFARPGVHGDYPGARWRPIEAPADGVSSTMVRAALARRRFAGLPVPGGALGEIVAGAYYNCIDETTARCAAVMRRRAARLDEGLRLHIEGVARLAARFAWEMGGDPRHGLLAGLAHDLFRATGPEGLRRRLAAGNERLTASERELPVLWHGPVAAAWLASSCRDVPVAVRRAVRWHSSVRSRNDRLARALIMADTLEFSRDKSELVGWRHDAVDNATRWRAVLQVRLAKLVRKERPVPVSLVQAWNDSLAAIRAEAKRRQHE